MAGDRDGAIADGAAHEAIALVGELHAVVLQMHMPHMRSDAARRNRAAPRRPGKVLPVSRQMPTPRVVSQNSDELVAAEILMVLDRQNSAFVGRARTALGERGANLGDELLPFVAERMTIAAQHRRQAMADDLGVENAGRAQRALERTHHQPGADDRRHAEAASRSRSARSSSSLIARSQGS